MVISRSLFTLALSLLNNGVSCPPGENHYEMERRVKEALDFTLSQVDIETNGSFMTIARFQNDSWQITCNGTVINVTCSAQVARLSVVIYITAPVNFILNTLMIDIHLIISIISDSTNSHISLPI